MSKELPDTIIIKKYSSRRLYDTHNKRFISMSRLGKMIREDQNVEIINKESGEDITKNILTQIIMEEEKENRDVLPVDLLHQLIRGGSSMYKDALENFLAKGTKTLHKAQKARDNVESSLFKLHRNKPTNVKESETDELEQIKARLAELEASLGRED